MLFPRLIPVLLVRGGALEKSRQFRKWTYVGDVLNAVRIFNQKEVDEIVVIDVEATKQGREPDFRFLRDLAGECFMPLTYGGGIANIEQAKRVMGTGVEKIVLNRAAFSNPELVGEVSNVLGSSSTVVSFDLGFRGGQLKRWDYVRKNWVKREEVANWVAKFEELGAGEFLLQNVQTDGQMGGPNFALADTFISMTSVPTVVAGGVAGLEDTKKLWRIGASGVAAGAWFVFSGPHRAVLINYPSYEKLQEAFAGL